MLPYSTVADGKDALWRSFAGFSQREERRVVPYPYKIVVEGAHNDN